jgi:hypothetical protein
MKDLPAQPEPLHVQAFRIPTSNSQGWRPPTKVIKKKKPYAKRESSRQPIRWHGDENEKLLLLIAYNRDYILQKLNTNNSMKNLPKVAQNYFFDKTCTRKLDVIRVHFHKMLPGVHEGKIFVKENGTMLSKIQKLVAEILVLQPFSKIFSLKPQRSIRRAAIPGDSRRQNHSPN